MSYFKTQMNNLAHHCLVLKEVKRQGGSVHEQVGDFPDIKYIGAWLPDYEGHSCHLRVWYDGPRISVQIHRYGKAPDVFTGETND